MLFNSYEFILGFAPIAIGVYFLLGKYRKLSLTWLTMSSLFFYAWWDPRFLGVICGSMAVNYFLGFWLMFRAETMSAAMRKSCVVLGITLNLALLCFYKYFQFILNQWFWLRSEPISAATRELPLGISFFTFVQVAFLVDAYRKEKMRYSPLEYGAFVTYFPHLIAGPIIHHTDVIPLLRKQETYRPHARNISAGLFLFSVGLFKKTVLADQVSAYVPGIFDAPLTHPLTIFEAWAGALSYTLQIYFDFSAYSDMALGVSKMMNIPLPANFFSPYQSVSIIEFWRRWHISLSRFLRDYLYIPLGGNRKGPLRRYGNLLTTMILGGLWHGAGWTFIIWGALHGTYLVINHGFSALKFVRLPKLMARGLTFLAVVVAWVFFRSRDVAAATRILKSMAGAGGISVGASVLRRVPALTGYGVQGNGFFPTMYEFQGSGIYWLSGLLLIAMLAPNATQILRKYKVATGAERLLSDASYPWHRQILWKPIPAWAVISAILFLTGMISINKNSVFLYFQF